MKSPLSLALATLTAALAFAAPTTAQGWLQRNPANSPIGRLSYSIMAYDANRGRTVLFGGFSVAPGTGTDLGDTWEWDGTNWQQMNPVHSPSARRFTALAFDANRNRVVLFGGKDFTGVDQNDTWEWDGNDWTQIFPNNSPAPRWIHTMTYDWARQRTVLFGGRGGAADTWEWDGVDWVQRFPANNPPHIESHAMAYDINRQVVVMYGGDLGGRSYIDETWEWDGTNWVQRLPAHDPGQRRAMSMAYSLARGTVMMFAGEDPSFASLTDTWEWDGTDWRLLHEVSGPEARRYHGVVYDLLRDRLVTFGGNSSNNTHLADTWEWAPDAATTRPYGTGCGASPLTLAALGRPALGATFQLETTNIDPATAAFGLVFSVTEHDPGIDLTPFGFTGCQQYTGSDIGVLIPVSGSMATFPVSVPNDTNLVGLHLYTQSLTATPGANPGGVLTSNAVDLGVNVR